LRVVTISSSICMICGTLFLLCWYLHLVVVGELECSNDPESYVAGSVATGRVTLGGQVEG